MTKIKTITAEEAAQKLVNLEDVSKVHVITHLRLFNEYTMMPLNRVGFDIIRDPETIIVVLEAEDRD